MAIEDKLAQRIKKIIKPRGRAHSRKTFHKIFFYTLSVASLILFLSTFILYGIFEKLSIEEIHKKSVENLEQTRSVFSSLHFRIIPSFIQLSYEPIISQLIYGSKSDFLFISRAYDRLDNALVANPVLHSIYVYNYLQQKFFSTFTGPESADNCNDAALLALLQNIKKHGVYRYIPRKIRIELDNKVQEENVLTLIIGDLPYSGKIIRGALIVNLSEHKMRRILFSGSSDNELLIIDKTGIVLSHPEKMFFGRNISEMGYIKEILENKASAGTFKSNIDGIKRLITFVSHPEMRWRFISITPYARIFSKIYQMRNITLLVFFILLVLTGCIAFMASRRIYSPIRNIFQFAMKAKRMFIFDSPKTGQRKKSELQHLDEVLKQVVKRVNTLNRHIKKYEDQHRHYILRKLLEGSLDPALINREENNLNLQLAGKVLIVAVLRFDRFQKLQKALNTDAVNQLREVINELACKMIDYAQISVDMGKDHIALVINADSRPANEEIKNIIIDQSLLLQRTIEDRLHTTITVGLSPPVNEYSKLAEAYNKAFTAAQFRFRFGNNSIIHYDNISPNITVKYQLPEVKIKNLIKELRLSRLNKVEELLDQIITGTLNSSYEDFILTIQNLTYMSKKAFQEMAPFEIPKLVDFNRLSENASCAETVDELRKILKMTYRQFMEETTKRSNNKNKEIITGLLAYIDSNLADPNLCPDMLAHNIHLSTNYVRRLFKDLTGISISEYITNLRIEHSKTMLYETSLPVNRIIEEAGFLNYNYFFTAFKKHTGLTPQQYRLKNV